MKWNAQRGIGLETSCIFSTGSVVYEWLCEALTNNALVKGIKQASPLAQTSCLKVFHSVLNHFAPKMIAVFLSWHVLQVQTDLIPSYKVVLVQINKILTDIMENESTKDNIKPFTLLLIL